MATIWPLEEKENNKVKVLWDSIKNSGQSCDQKGVGIGKWLKQAIK